MKRWLSHSEVSAALDCQVKHAFAYTGALTDGTALRPIAAMPVLEAGRAWGDAMAVWHHGRDGKWRDDVLRKIAHDALRSSLDEQAAELVEHDVFDLEERDELRSYLTVLLDDYMAHNEPLNVVSAEHRLRVGIPSRAGRRHSSRYGFECFIDGIHVDDQGRDWIVEFKLRGRLQPLELIEKSRQLRWYAWAWREASGHDVAGIVNDERLNAVPAEVRLNRDGAISRQQSCRSEAYEEVCRARGVDGAEDVLLGLRGRAWERRHFIKLSNREIEEASRQLVSAAKQIQALEGENFPIRNPSPMRCPSCQFTDICVDPTDTALIDAMFVREPTKRNRESQESAGVA